VLRTGRLGDLAVLTPALRLLRQSVPQAHITLLVNERALPLAQRLRSVDEVIQVPDLNAMQRLGRGEPDAQMRELLADLQAKHFDLALQCAGGGETTNAFVRALGAHISAGQQWPDSPPLDVWMPYQRNQADVLRLMDLMELIGAAPGPLIYDLEVTPEDELELARIQQVPHDALYANNLIAVALGAGSGARCWPVDRFADVVRAVLNRDRTVQVVLTGTAPEAALTEDLVRRLDQDPRVVDLAGKLSLGALLALVSHARLFIGNDSAPAHFANALGTPSVVVFGSAHPAQWASPSRVWHRAVADESAPCRRFSPPCGCPDDARALCIVAVTVSEVLTQVEAVLGLISSGSTQGASHERSTTVVGRSW
jgi:ADP-heptose:LPS heptosyltransferase